MKTKTQTIHVAITRTLAHREVAPGVSAFKLTDNFEPKHLVPAWCRNLLHGAERQGMAKTSVVKRFEQGRTPDLHGDPHYWLVPAEYLTLVQTQGFTAPESDKALCDRIAEANKTPMDVPKGWCVVVVDYASHMLFDVNGVPLPVGLYYDYSSGMARDGAYDLEKMVPYLTAHPQVHGLQGKPLSIQSVPYYNVSPGCSRFTTFVFAPNQEQMVAMWAKAKELNKRYPSTALREAVFELDLMGLRAAGIARSDSFYGVSEEPEPDEDD